MVKITNKTVIRKRLGLAASAVIHGLLFAMLFTLPPSGRREDEHRLRVDIFFQEPYEVADPVMAPPLPQLEDEPVAVPHPSPPREAADAATSPAPARAKEETPPPPNHEAEQQYAPAVAPVVAEPKPPAPRRQILTDLFEESRSRPAAATPAPEETTRTGAFDSGEEPVATSTDRSTLPAMAAVGSFENGAHLDGLKAGAAARPAVRRGSFGDAITIAQPRPARAMPVPDPILPVEIVSKPKPVYTEQARRLRVEGEVVLEVLFGASGQIRVLRVLKGLGHGLDAAAVEAAKRITFKAARLNGKPIDCTATLRVVFQLA